MAENEAYYAEIERTLRFSGQDALAVSYEDLGSRAEHSRLLAYLDIENSSVPLVARSVKQNPTDLRRLVANYDEVLNALGGTELVAELLSSQN
jgi:hypothetical protein